MSRFFAAGPGREARACNPGEDISRSMFCVFVREPRGIARTKKLTPTTCKNNTRAKLDEKSCF